MKSMLNIVGVEKTFQGKKILDDLSMTLNKGDLFGLIGTSGAGKTTLLKTIIGFTKPDKGKIYYRDRDITENLDLIKRTFGFATQDKGFYEELSLKSNMYYFGKMYDIPSKELDERISYLLELVGLENYMEYKAQNLSGGMKRRLDIAISLLHKPEVLILDEPTSGLDPDLRKKMWYIIKRINSYGVTILMSSHLLEEMEYLCNNIALIKKGRITVSGTPGQLKSFYSKNHEVRIKSSPGNYKSLLTNLSSRGIPINQVSKRDDFLVYYTNSPYKSLEEIPRALTDTGEQPIEVSVEQPNLNEVFEAFNK